MQLKPFCNMGCQSLSEQLDLMMLQSTSVPLDNLHRIWPNGYMASHRACTRTGSRMATSTTIKHRSRHWEKERALRAAADAAPTRATRFLKPVIGVEVRSVA